MSPLAILAFKRSVVGDTGLKTGWVWGTLRTLLILTALWLLSLGKSDLPWVTVLTAVLSNCTYFIAKLTQKRILRKFTYKKCAQNFHRCFLNGAYCFACRSCSSVLRSGVYFGTHTCRSQCHSWFCFNTTAHTWLYLALFALAQILTNPVFVF